MENSGTEVELLRNQNRRLKIALALTIVAGLLVSSWQARRATHVAELARKEEIKLRQIAEVAVEEARQAAEVARRTTAGR